MFSMYELDREEMQVELSFDKQESAPWWNFEPLNYLDLSSNVIQEIPANIKMFEDLAVLNVSVKSAFWSYLTFHCLQLQDNSLTTLPSEIGRLTKLTKLNASHNHIKMLPNEFYKLTELQVLSLSHNCLESFTKDIGDLIMLQQLVTITVYVDCFRFDGLYY